MRLLILLCFPFISFCQKKDTITIAAVGDIMIGTNFPSKAYLPPNDGKDIFTPVLDHLISADLTFGNAEGTFLDSGGTVKKCSDSTKCYAFRQPTRYAKYLYDAGFDVISIANNHVGDFGDAGRRGTVHALESAGLEYAGLVSIPFSVFDRDSVRYGFCAFAPNTGTMSLNNIDSAVAIVAHLDSLCDIVIVSFHGGAEGATKNHVIKGTEIFLGENRGDLVRFSHAVIDAGADIVLGHGPHVTRALELYKEKLIAYSLGNFATYARFNLKGRNGIAPILKARLTRDGKFIDGSIIPVQQLGEGGPTMDPEGKVIKEIQTLTKEDFPQTPLIIRDDGQVNPR